MLSIKEAIARLDGRDRRFQSALGCYLAAISAISEQAVEVTPELTRENRLALRELQSKLAGSPDIEALTESRATLLRAMEDYRSKTAACLSRREEDLRGMLVSMAEAVGTVAGNSDRHSVRLNRFREHLQDVSAGSDFTKMRRELAGAVEELKSAQAAMSRENGSSVAGLQEQLMTFQKRLERTEARAFEDRLTGLLNRGEGEARLAELLKVRLGQDQPASVILIDLDDFKEINDNFGHASGDQVLRLVADILSSQVRSGDTICRWGGDEFLLMGTGDRAMAEQMAARLRLQVGIRCRFSIDGKTHEVGISACAGVAQARPGESKEEVVARADTELYRQKRARHKRDAPPPAIVSAPGAVQGPVQGPVQRDDTANLSRGVAEAPAP